MRNPGTISDVIVVVEGPSAAGKTTWVQSHGSAWAVAESAGPIPPPSGSVHELAAFWMAANSHRWTEALRLEAEHGVAVCDTDPLKLHYDYCLARVGHASWDRFDAGVSVAATAIAGRRIGIADVVVLNVPDDATLARQRDGDSSRRRGNFDLHRLLGPGLRDWYGALDEVDPGRVLLRFPSELPAQVERARYDSELFRTWMAHLPRVVPERRTGDAIM